MNYPDGNQALYDYSKGAVSDVRMKIGSSILNDATGITYRPMELAMSGWTSSNGLTNTITYDSDLRPTKLIVPGVQAIVYTYDAANRLTGINDGYNPPNLDETLTYDALGRLTVSSSPSENESYTYDADGNRAYQVINGVATRFAYATGSNRLQSAQVQTTIGGAGATYGYDADGNTTAVDGLAAYTYGPFGRLINAGGTAFVVSAEAQRIRKSGGSGDTYFAPGPEGALLAEDNSGSWDDYIWLNGRLVGFARSGSIYAIHGDHLGRPEAVTAPSTLTVWRASDYPFTQRVAYDNLGAFNLGFPGQYYDSESGLWHNGYRDYNASLGRYIESDPIGLGGGINTYAYVGNNPISNVDPLGLCDKKPNCNTVLPNGQTIGQVVQNSVATIQIAASFDPSGSSKLGAFLATVQSHGPIDFKNNMGPDPTGFLGAAGNFAYGAIASGIGYSQSFAELGAGAYALQAGKFNLSNPYGEDNSAAQNLPAGYATLGCTTQ